MLKRFLITALLGFFASVIFAFQEPPKPPEEEDLTLEQALKMLKEIHELMQGAEEWLEAASLGKAIEKQEEIIKRLKQEFKNEEITELQKKILQLIDKILKKSSDRQQDVIKKLTELLKKAKEGEGNCPACQRGFCPKHQQRPQEKQPKSGQSQPKQPGGPAQQPYDPSRTDPPSKFRSLADRKGEWGNLPPKERDAMLQEMRLIELFPAEYHEALRKYWKRLADESRNQ